MNVIYAVIWGVIFATIIAIIRSIKIWKLRRGQCKDCKYFKNKDCNFPSMQERLIMCKTGQCNHWERKNE